MDDSNVIHMLAAVVPAALAVVLWWLAASWNHPAKMTCSEE